MMMIQRNYPLKQMRNYLSQRMQSAFHMAVGTLPTKRIVMAIIGGGPAGFYTAKKILEENEDAQIHIFEKLPFPFGLIRYGVAPDHQAMKNISKDLTEIGKNPQVHFFGNVALDKSSGENNLTLKDLLPLYSGVIFCYGAQNEKTLDRNKIAIDPAARVYSGRDIVCWYNGHPEFKDLQINFAGVKNLAIIGNGNVALDVARIIIRARNGELDQSDISGPALAVLKKHEIENIHIIGRRGLIQAQFSMKEFREFTQTKGTKFFVHEKEYADSLNESSKMEYSEQMNSITRLARVNKRRFEVLEKIEKIPSSAEATTQPDTVNVHLRALLTTKSIQPHNLLLARNQLEGKPFEQIAVEDSKQPLENIKADMVVESIGYESANIDPEVITWDEQKKVIANQNGCLLSKSKKDQIIIGLYAAGWVKGGPQGIIDQTITSSIETVNNLNLHIKANALELKDTSAEQVRKIIEGKNKKPVIGWKEWEKLDSIELERGKVLQKLREKILSPQEALELLKEKLG